MSKTSHSTIPTLQQDNSLRYIVQPKVAATEDLDREIYEKEHLAFELKQDLMGIKFLGFAQRRFIGFRNRFEFEKKRLIVSNKH